MGSWDRANINLKSELTNKGTKRVRFFRDLAGIRFGNVEVIRRCNTKGHNVTWVCKCHACGKEFERLAVTLRASKTKSCGCIRRQQNSANVHWKGVGDISATIYGFYVKNSIRRGIEFNITHKYMWDLFLSQNRKCALTGVDLVFGRRGRDENTASLDRRDSKLPYQVGNVQWVHKHINQIKWSHSQDYFIKLCSMVAFNQNQI